MTAGAAPSTFSHEVWLKDTKADCKQPVWCWRLWQGGVVVGFGERLSEREAVLAAQSAQLNHGRRLQSAE